MLHNIFQESGSVLRLLSMRKWRHGQVAFRPIVDTRRSLYLRKVTIGWVLFSVLTGTSTTYTEIYFLVQCGTTGGLLEWLFTRSYWLANCELRIGADHDTRPSTQPFGYSNLSRTRGLLTSMIEDLCAIVPYHFGISETPSPTDSVNINGIGIAARRILFWRLRTVRLPRQSSRTGQSCV